MQFFGYLRRNPNDPQDSDYTGYDFWLTKLNQFGGNFQNAEMVKAFLSSSEYRQRFGPCAETKKVRLWHKSLCELTIEYDTHSIIHRRRDVGYTSVKTYPVATASGSDKFGGNV
jgi:hypothetical protein